MTKPSHHPSISALNALDIALESQSSESQLRQTLGEMLPVLEAIEKLCRHLDGQPPEIQSARVPSLALLADLADQAASRVGLERNARAGNPVNREFHEVIQTQVDDEKPPGTILEVVETGWALGGRPLKMAKVVASMRSPAS